MSPLARGTEQERGVAGPEGSKASWAWYPSRAAVAVGLLAASLFPLIAWRAMVRAPPGQVFAGSVSSQEDVCNYLGYAQQISEGSLLFRNKLTSLEHKPALFNLEWTAVGVVSWALGNRPFLAFRIIGVLATLLFAALVEAWLLDCGLARRRRLAALLLVFTGGGLGGLALTSGLTAVLRPYDLLAGFYPFLMVITNPHFVIGTTLVLAALRQLARGRVGWGVALCATLALVRPYDCVLVVAVDAAVVVLSSRPRGWLRRLAPWGWLAPVLAYNAWLFLFNRAYAAFSYGSASRALNFAPSLAETALALGPAALLAVTSFARPAADHSPRLYLALWAITAAAVVFIHPVSFSLQIGVGMGVPLLVLGAVGLARMPRGVLETMTLLLSGSLLVLLSAFWLAPPGLYVPETSRRLAAGQLHDACRPGQRLLAPRDLGLLAEVYTSCSLYLPYSLVPEYAERQRDLDGFYGDWSSARRSDLLERACIDHVVLPRSGDETVAALLGPDAPFLWRGSVSGTGPALQVASRSRRCARAAPDALPSGDRHE